MDGGRARSRRYWKFRRSDCRPPPRRCKRDLASRRVFTRGSQSRPICRYVSAVIDASSASSYGCRKPSERRERRQFPRRVPEGRVKEAFTLRRIIDQRHGGIASKIDGRLSATRTLSRSLARGDGEQPAHFRIPLPAIQTANSETIKSAKKTSKCRRPSWILLNGTNSSLLVPRWIH